MSKSVGSTAKTPKWTSNRTQQAVAAANRTGGPGFEDSAISEASRKQVSSMAGGASMASATQTAASQQPQQPTHFDRQEAGDALSNLFHTDEEVEVYKLQGPDIVEANPNSRFFHDALMERTERIGS